MLMIFGTEGNHKQTLVEIDEMVEKNPSNVDDR